MSSFIVEGNSEFDDEFANKDKPIKLELFPMLHTVITSRDPANLPFVNKLGENTYYFTTRSKDNRYIRIEIFRNHTILNM